MAAHVLRRLRHATWPPGQRHAVKPAIISNFPFHPYHSLKPGRPSRPHHLPPPPHPTHPLRPAPLGHLPAGPSTPPRHRRHGQGTGETDPPAESAMATRRADGLAKGLPYLVAVDEQGPVLGFDNANWFKPRP